MPPASLFVKRKKKKKKVTGQRKCPCDSTERTAEISQEGDDFEYNMREPCCLTI